MFLLYSRMKLFMSIVLVLLLSTNVFLTRFFFQFSYREFDGNIWNDSENSKHDSFLFPLFISLSLRKIPYLGIFKNRSGKEKTANVEDINDGDLVRIFFPSPPFFCRVLLEL